MKKVEMPLKTLLALSSVIALMACLESSRAFAASSTPAPSPTARPATSAEQAIFAKFSPPGWSMDGYAVAGNYALVGYYNANGGVTGLLTYSNSAWSKVIITGGQLMPTDIVNDIPAIPLSVATSLYNLYLTQDTPSP